MPPRPISSRSSYRPAIRSPADMRAQATSRASLAENGFERVVPDRERLVELRVREGQWCQHPDAVRVDPRLQQEQAALRRGFGDRGGEVGGRRPRGAVLHELDREHRSETTDVADLREALLP